MDSQYKSPAAALVESVEKLQLTDGDILLCRLPPGNVTGDQINKIQSVLSMLPKTVRVLLVCSDFDITLLDESLMAASGWVRASKQSEPAT
jgi:hypothetical protein